METHHQILIPIYKEIIEAVETKTQEAKQGKMSRSKTLEHIGSFIRIHIDRMRKFLDVQNT